MLYFNLSSCRIVAVHSLHQNSQSLGALIGTHLTLAVGYLGIDLFKYRRMALFLFQSYDTIDDQSRQNVPSSAAKINSDATITYVPVERRENWANILGDIRNPENKARKGLAPTEEIQIIDGVPVVLQKRRSPNVVSEVNGNEIVVPRLPSAKVFSPQRRGSADAKMIKLVKANDSIGSNISFPRGKSAVDLRKLHEQEENTISFHRTLTQSEISGIIGSGKDRTRGTYIEDGNGKIRERIIIRRKRSAPNQESLTVSPEFKPDQRGSPMEKICEKTPVESVSNNVSDTATEVEEDNVIKITRAR